MAKTGKLAAFTLGEKNTAMVNLPAQFVTSSAANMKGQQYSDLVDYANNAEKTSDLNNESIVDLITLKEQLKAHGYANRNTAVTETHPIFGENKLNYDNHDISLLRQELDEAQLNGNNIHELAFSIRGDWLVKNHLYDPDTRMIDQNKLKHAEQDVAKILINKGFNLPLGEDANDVVWFGVIHQDTDHLNMHLWFAKKSKETRPEMLKQEGKFKGQPIGVIPLEVIEQAKRQFKKQLMSSQELMRREAILRGVGSLKNDIVALTPDNMLNGHYAKAIKEIYDALPQDMRGRWQVGNTKLTRGQGKMAKANQLTNTLLDAMFKNELKDEFSSFKSLAQEFDAINIEDQGVMHRGRRKWSENKEEELRKRLANQLYEILNHNQIDDNSVNEIDSYIQKLLKVNDHVSYTKQKSKSELVPSPQKKFLNQNRVFNTQGQLDKHKYTILGPSFNKIHNLWQQDIRSEINIERQFLRNQKTVEEDEIHDEYQSQLSKKY